MLISKGCSSGVWINRCMSLALNWVKITTGMDLLNIVISLCIVEIYIFVGLRALNLPLIDSINFWQNFLKDNKKWAFKNRFFYITFLRKDQKTGEIHYLTHPAKYTALQSHTRMPHLNTMKHCKDKATTPVTEFCTFCAISWQILVKEVCNASQSVLSLNIE